MRLWVKIVRSRFSLLEAVQAGAVSVWEGADPAFASGSPFDGSAERFSVFVGAPQLRRFALARDHHVGDTEVGELLIDLGLAVAAGARIRVAAIRDVTPAQPAADQTRAREHAGVRVLSWHGNVQISSGTSDNRQAVLQRL